jgi:arylsulfatase A-like enzyme
MLIRLILFLLFNASALHSLTQPKSDSRNEREKRPNVVLILMDDMGYGDLECYGGFPYHTPNLNKLAAEGMRFTNYYAAQAVCSASRASLLTGCYPNRVGISGALMPDSRIALHGDEETLPELLRESGYATGMVGKWHLGQKQPFLPLQNGFEEYHGLPYSNDMWPVDYDGLPVHDTSLWQSRYPPLPLIEGNEPVRYIRTLDDQSGLTKYYTDQSVDFIRRNKNKPFFLYLAQSMPHVPIAASPAFRGKSSEGLYGDVMEEIDASIGTILRTLEENGLTKNTLVIFTSDNGPWLTFGNHAGNTGGLREGKGTAWEGGLRVPCIIKYPNIVPPGTVSNQIMASMDFLPTIVKICGARLPSRKIDGLDISPLFARNNKAIIRDEFAYYYDKNSLKAIRKGRWKLVFKARSQTYKTITAIGADGHPGKYASIDVEPGLYDLRTDPGETLDVKDRHPDIVKELNMLAEKYREELGDDLTNRIGKEVRPAAQVK